MTSKRLGFALILGVLSASGCMPFGGRDEVLDGPYRLWAADIDEDMFICWSIPDTGGCVGDGLPGPTVFAAGFDARYLVAAVHPKKPTDRMDRSVTQYFYVIRSPDEARKFPYGKIRGPFDKASYEVEKRRLHLPEFTRTFENLR